MIKQARICVVVHWLIFAFSVVAILGMAVPNCQQTVSFGEALWHMRIEPETPVLFLMALVQTVLVYAHCASRQNIRARLLVAIGGAMCASAISATGHLDLHEIPAYILFAPYEPVEIAKGVPGFVWAEGYVLSSAFGMWVWLWTIVAMIDIWKETTTRRNLSSRSRAEGSA